jgi:hypothetical protein
VGTRSVIARPIPEGGFYGTSCHYDGYPAHQGRVLFDAVTGHLAGDTDAACSYLIDQHPAGRSVLHGDFTTRPATSIPPTPTTDATSATATANATTHPGRPRPPARPEPPMSSHPTGCRSHQPGRRLAASRRPGLDRHPGLGRDRQPRQPPAPPALTAQSRPTTANNPTQHPVGAGRRVTQEPSVPGAEGSLHLGSPPGRWWRLVALRSRCTDGAATDA